MLTALTVDQRLVAVAGFVDALVAAATGDRKNHQNTKRENDFPHASPGRAPHVDRSKTNAEYTYTVARYAMSRFVFANQEKWNRQKKTQARES